MLNKLAELANKLDARGYVAQANFIDALIKVLADSKDLEIKQIFVEAKDKSACEMCGEFEKLTKEETGQGDVMMLCKQCKKDYSKK